MVCEEVFEKIVILVYNFEMIVEDFEYIVIKFGIIVDELYVFY